MTSRILKIFSVIRMITLSLIVMGTSIVSYATDVYITRDKDGNPVFSDQPSTNAEKIIIEDIQVIPKSQSGTGSSSSASKIKELPKYNDFKILSPKNDEAIRENTGAISIQLSLTPELRGNDVIKLYMDGKVVYEGSDLSINLKNIDRGTHVFQAAVTTADDTKAIQSGSVTVHLLRVSAINNN